ncbi:MAG: ABC transporter permease [Flavobacteriales bacterium]|nr:ABC transporter permease [Flavobacteriales bacterium]
MFVLRKIGYAILILFSVATVVFWLFSFSFPSPEEILVTDRTDESTLNAIREELKLDQPKGVQYISFLNDLSPISLYPTNNVPDVHHVSLGLGSKAVVLKLPYLRRSFITGQPTASLLIEAFKGTLILAVSAMVMATLIGLIFGVSTTFFPGGWMDRSIVFLSTLGISVPSFFSAIILSWLFGYVLHQTTGLPVVGSWIELNELGERVIRWPNLILPAIALGIRPLAIITQLTRNSMLDALGQDYIRTARAKGLGTTAVYFKHALKSALNPVITSISGWFASLLAGAFFVEYIFSWKGLGALTIHALETSDLPVVMAAIVFIAAIFVVINFLVDVLYTYLDPRIRLS